MAEFSLGEALLGTGIDLSGLNKGIDDAEAKAKGGFGRIGDILGGALKVGLAGAAVGFGALGVAIAGGVGDAREAAQLYAATEQVIASTGNAAGKSADQITDLATALSASKGQSLFGDDQIQASENLLLTFTNIKGAVFDAATAISVDMAQALGGEPKAQAIQLGKALNDPIAGVSALSRVGVTFTEQQKKQIKVMQEAGDVAGAQGIILAELNKEFGGQAAAAAKADGGWAQFKDRMGEAAETAGGALLPILGMVASVANDVIAPAIETAAQAFSDLVGYFSAVAEDGDTLNDFLGNLPPSIQPVVKLIADLAVAFGTGAGGNGLIGGITNALYSLDTISPVFDILGDTINLLVDEVDRLSAAFSEGGISGLIDALVTDITGALPGIEAALLSWGQSLIDWITPFIPPMLDALNAALTSAWAWVQEQAPGWIAQLGAWGQSLIDWAAPYIPLLLDQLQGLADQAWAWVVAQVPGWKEQLQSWANELVAWIGPMIPPALAALGDLGVQLLAWVGAQAALLLQSFLAWKDSFIAWIPGATVTFLAEWPKMFDQFLDWIGKEAGPLLAKLGDWALSFIGWIAPMIPPFLVALAGVVLAIGVWIVETAAVLSKKIVEVWIPAILGWIVTDAIPKLVIALNDFLKVFQGWIQDAQNALAQKMIELGSSVIAGLKKGIGDAWSGIKAYLHDLAMSLPEWFRDWWGIKSPSRVMAQTVGEPLMAGLISGMGSMLPGLISMIDGISATMIDSLTKNKDEMSRKIEDMSQALVAQVADMSAALNDAMSSAFSGEASIDRLKAKNLVALAEISDANRKSVEEQLALVASIASQYADPKAGAAYLKMRSDQIFELTKLQEEMDAATDADQKARLLAQIGLISEAQRAEQNAFDINNPRTASPLDAISAQLQAILSQSGIPLPGLTESPLTNALNTLIGQLSAAGGAFATPTINIDARGANLTEAQIAAIAQRAYDEAARAADARRRTGG